MITAAATACCQLSDKIIFFLKARVVEMRIEKQELSWRRGCYLVLLGSGSGILSQQIDIGDAVDAPVLFFQHLIFQHGTDNC